MKKIIAFFTKGTKIARILTYIYKGLVIASVGFNAAIKKLAEEFEEVSFMDTLETISEYVDVAISALRQILEWLGVDVETVEAEARAEAVKKHRVKKGDVKIAKSNAALIEITDKLKEELGK